jgi:hypothetical protein
MKLTLWFAPVLALGLAGAPALASSAADDPAVAEARIPFANTGGIRDWRAADGDTIYVQDRARRWYRAELAYRAFGLPHAWAIGFETRGIDSFDRFSNVVVEGQRVPVRSLVRVDEPPARRDAAQHDEA